MPSCIPDLFNRTRLIHPSALGRHIKRFHQGEMNDTHLVLDGVPELSTPAFDREVAVVHVRNSNDLLAKVEVEEALVRVTVSVVVSVDVGQHVVEDGGIGFDGQHPRVEPDRESWVV